MSVKVDYIVNTQSKEEREELIGYLSSKGLFIGLTQDHDGFQLAGITYSGQVGFLSIITENNLIDVHGYKRFTSVKDFISFYEGK